MALTNDTTTPPALVPVTFDLYRDIHKAIRSELFCAVARAGQTDPGDGVAVADLAAQVARLVDLLDLHAEHEDAHVQPAIVEVDPSSAERIEADHAGSRGPASASWPGPWRPPSSPSPPDGRSCTACTSTWPRSRAAT
jgi:hypothetical protein